MKKTTRKRIVIEVPKELIKLSDEQKAKLSSAFKSVLVDVLGESAKLGSAGGGDGDELNPITENT